MISPEQAAALPGSEIVLAGVRDLQLDRETVNALAVSSAATRLRELGMPVPEQGGSGRPAAHRLYELIAAEAGDGAHSRYNAVLARVASFARAAERAGTR